MKSLSIQPCYPGKGSHSFSRRLVLAALTGMLLATNASAQKKNATETEVTIEQVAQQCKGLPRDQRVVIKVGRFSVSSNAAKTNSGFGDELATMLTSALQQTNCFRVMETNKNISDATGEIAFGQDGFTAGGNGPRAGQMIAAQLIVTGEVTDYSEGSSSRAILGVASQNNSATIGFTLKVLNPETYEVLYSKDIKAAGKNSSKAVDLFGVRTTSNTENRAAQDAIYKSIVSAVETLVTEKENMDIPEPRKPVEIVKYGPQNCQMLKGGSPKVIVLVTEATTAGTERGPSDADLERREREMYLREQEANAELAREIVSNIFKSKKRRDAEIESMKNAAPETTTQTSATAQIKKVVIEQTATETELTKRFVESGFLVVDPKMYGKMRQLSDSTGDIAQMAALGLQMGANIIITGQAISERVNSEGGMVACRARLEIRAISAVDGTILATNTVSGGGIDVSEAVANKQAFQNASENMSQYLMERLCNLNIQFAGAAPQPGGSASQGLSDITVSNVNFSKLNILAAALGKSASVKSVKKSIKGTEGSLQIEHSGSTDELIDLLGKIPAVKFEVAELEEGKAAITLQ